MTLSDSGTRREFPSGAVRDMSEGKGRFDLLPPFALDAVAKLMERGANKYGDKNCYLGIPNSSFIDSGMRHLNKFVRGEWDEPHLVQAAWNILMAIDQQERVKRGTLDPKYDDIGVRVEAAEPIRPAHISVVKGNLPQYTKEHNICKDWDAINCEQNPCPDCDINEKFICTDKAGL